MKLRDRNKIKEIKDIQLNLIEDQSMPSYKIKIDNRGKQLEAIANFFNININEYLKKHFEEVTNGQGNEKNKILTLHSSSLLAFLCFYNISAQNPLKIKIELEPGEEDEFEFTEVFFEIENNVEGKDDPHPSSMDIVLYDRNRKTMLFLESKFTEPIYGGSVRLNRDIYFDILNEISFEPIATKKLDKISFSLKSVFNIDKRERNIYGEGIKQMIAHYLGIKNGPKNSSSDISQKLYSERYSEAKKLILGSILFSDKNINIVSESERFFDPIEKEMLERYIAGYKKLMNGLQLFNKSFETKNEKEIYLLNGPLFYEDVFNHFPLDTNVRTFYNL